MATDHLERCVKLLNEASKKGRTLTEMALGYEATFELLVEDWGPEIPSRDELTWREGYEQCLQDVVDAIAEEWGVKLPTNPLRQKEKASESV